MEFEENLEVITIRIFPSVLKKMDLVLKLDNDEVFENRSHFIRCSINSFLKSAKVKKIIDGDEV